VDDDAGVIGIDAAHLYECRGSAWVDHQRESIVVAEPCVDCVSKSMDYVVLVDAVFEGARSDNEVHVSKISCGDGAANAVFRCSSSR
jgi:hypothetical protein